MWHFVFFDLPVETPKERKAAARFRKDLLKDGFSMMQFSVYIRHCASDETTQVHTNRVQRLLPTKGLVSVLKVTDEQYGNILNFFGREPKLAASTPQQLELL